MTEQTNLCCMPSSRCLGENGQVDAPYTRAEGAEGAEGAISLHELTRSQAQVASQDEDEPTDIRQRRTCHSPSPCCWAPSCLGGRRNSDLYRQVAVSENPNPTLGENPALTYQPFEDDKDPFDPNFLASNHTYFCWRLCNYLDLLKQQYQQTDNCTERKRLKKVYSRYKSVLTNLQKDVGLTLASSEVWGDKKRDIPMAPLTSAQRKHIKTALAAAANDLPNGDIKNELTDFSNELHERSENNLFVTADEAELLKLIITCENTQEKAQQLIEYFRAYAQAKPNRGTRGSVCNNKLEAEKCIRYLEKVLEICKKYTVKETYLSTADMAQVSLLLEKVAKHSPEQDLAELTQILSVEYAAQWSRMEQYDQDPELRKKYQYLTKSNTWKDNKVSANIGISASLPKAVSVGFGVKPFYNDSRDTDADGLVFRDQIMGISAKLHANLGLDIDSEGSFNLGVGAFTGGTFWYSNMTEFSNVREMLDLEGHRLAWGRRDLYKNNGRSYTWLHKTMRNMPGRSVGSELKEKHRLHSSAEAANERRNDLEDILNVRYPDVTITAHFPQPLHEERPIPLYGYIDDYSAKGGVDAGIGPVSGDANYKHRKNYVTQYTDEFFSSWVKQNPDYLEKAIPPKYLGLYIDWMKKAKYEDLNFCLAEFVVEGIKEIHDDYKKYVQIIQNIQYKKGIGKKYSSDKTLEELKTEKHRMEKEVYGTTGKLGVAQRVAASLAMLGREILADDIFVITKGSLDEDEVRAEFKAACDLVENPPFRHKQRQLQHTISLQRYLLYDRQDHQGSFSINLPSVSGNVTIRDRHRVHPSRWREGTYRDISFTGTIHGDMAQAISAITKAVNNLGHNIEDLAIPNVNLGIDGNLTYHWRYYIADHFQDGTDFEGSKKKPLVWHRLEAGLDANLDIGGDIPIPGAEVSLGINLNRNTSEVVKEYSGTHTWNWFLLNFSRMRLRADGDLNNQEWRKLCEEQKPQWGEMLCRIGEDLPLAPIEEKEIEEYKTQHNLRFELEWFAREQIRVVEQAYDEAKVKVDTIEEKITDLRKKLAAATSKREINKLTVEINEQEYRLGLAQQALKDALEQKQQIKEKTYGELADILRTAKLFRELVVKNDGKDADGHQIIKHKLPLGASHVLDSINDTMKEGCDDAKSTLASPCTHLASSAPHQPQAPFYEKKLKESIETDYHPLLHKVERFFAPTAKEWRRNHVEKWMHTDRIEPSQQAHNIHQRVRDHFGLYPHQDHNFNLQLREKLKERNQKTQEDRNERGNVLLAEFKQKIIEVNGKLTFAHQPQQPIPTPIGSLPGHAVGTVHTPPRSTPAQITPPPQVTQTGHMMTDEVQLLLGQVSNLKDKDMHAVRDGTSIRFIKIIRELTEFLVGLGNADTTLYNDIKRLLGQEICGVALHSYGLDNTVGEVALWSFSASNDEHQNEEQKLTKLVTDITTLLQ